MSKYRKDIRKLYKEIRNKTKEIQDIKDIGDVCVLYRLTSDIRLECLNLIDLKDKEDALAVTDEKEKKE